MAKGLFESENIAAPHVEEVDIPSGITYRARFIVAGPVGYADGVYFLDQCALDCFACTLKGKPVVIGHQDILDEEDMKKKAVGYVSQVDRDEEGGWWADFVVFDSEANTKIEEGATPYVSCAYRADLSEEDLTINNVKYKKRIVGGEMLHLALVKNPRYNGTEVWRNSADDCLVSDGVLFNTKDKMMFGFKITKQKVELDKDTLINTSSGEKTLEQLVNDLEAANQTIAEQAEQIKDLQAQVEAKETQPETAPVEEIQPTVEEAAPATETVEETPKVENAVEDTDAEFKKDLNNSLAVESKKIVVEVPTIC